MNSRGGESADLMVQARSALLDVLDALREHRGAVVVIGAQAVYLRTGGIDVALAEATKDSDVALDPRDLGDDPRVESAMRDAGFLPAVSGQPGAWINTAGVPVDLMVPELLAGPGGVKARGARIPPHDKRAARRARGLEAALVDRGPLDVESLDGSDARSYSVDVAGPAALLVAKLHKLGERASSPQRLNDKDAHDAYRLLRAVDTEVLADSFVDLRDAEVSGEVTQEALGYLRDLFVEGPDALGSMMAGRAESGVGEPAQVAMATSILADDLINALGGPE